MVKKIIFVPAHRVKNLTSTMYCHTWGIGDMLRGMIATYLFCHKNGYEFYVDFQFHEIGQFLEKNAHPYEKLITENIDNIYFATAGEFNSYVEKILLSDDEVHFFYTNGFGSRKDDAPDYKTIIKKMITPSPLLETHINSYIQKMPFATYEIIHCRFNDNDCIANEQNEKEYDDAYKKIMPFIKDNSVLISNSIHFKKIIKASLPDLFCLETKTCHVGYGSNNDTEQIMDTMIDFFLLRSATKIYTYSIYGWTSGFVDAASELYEIPVCDVRRI